jgi:hypothetical protein
MRVVTAGGARDYPAGHEAGVRRMLTGEPFSVPEVADDPALIATAADLLAYGVLERV